MTENNSDNNILLGKEDYVAICLRDVLFYLDNIEESMIQLRALVSELAAIEKIKL